MIKELIDKVSRSRGEERANLIHQIALYPDEALEAAVGVPGTARTVGWRLAIEIIHTIGYPRNAPAIPMLIAGVSDKNFVALQEAIVALLEIGPDVVVPYLIQKIWGGKHDPDWGYEVESICETLCMMGREYLMPCGPVITYILSTEGLPPRDLDKGILLDALEAIGPECAVYALPTLIQFAQKEGTSEQGMQARRLIRSFSEEARAPYALVLASLEETTESNTSN